MIAIFVVPVNDHLHLSRCDRSWRPSASLARVFRLAAEGLVTPAEIYWRPGLRNLELPELFLVYRPTCTESDCSQRLNPLKSYSPCKNPDWRVVSESRVGRHIYSERLGLAHREGRGLMYLAMYTAVKAGLGNDRKSRAVKWFRPPRYL
jgi:hypothetical protein